MKGFIIAISLGLLTACTENHDLHAFCEYNHGANEIQRAADVIYGEDNIRTDEQQAQINKQFALLKEDMASIGYPDVIALHQLGLENQWFNQCKKLGYEV